jgi:hypothetical protein
MLPQANNLIEYIELVSRYASFYSNSGRKPDIIIK